MHVQHTTALCACAVCFVEIAVDSSECRNAKLYVHAMKCTLHILDKFFRKHLSVHYFIESGERAFFAPFCSTSSSLSLLLLLLLFIRHN